MNQKILYITTTAVIAMTAFFIGKNSANSEDTAITEPITSVIYVLENNQSVQPDLQDISINQYGIQLTFSDETGYWIQSEEMEEQGLIHIENIVNWNINDEQLSVNTASGYEWYAYK